MKYVAHSDGYRTIFKTKQIKQTNSWAEIISKVVFNVLFAVVTVDMKASDDRTKIALNKPAGSSDDTFTILVSQLTKVCRHFDTTSYICYRYCGNVFMSELGIETLGSFWLLHSVFQVPIPISVCPICRIVCFICNTYLSLFVYVSFKAFLCIIRNNERVGLCVSVFVFLVSFITFFCVKCPILFL